MTETKAGVAHEAAFAASQKTGAASTGRARTGAQILVDSLITHGARRAFCVPGESYLAVLDALSDVQDTLQLVVARHEAGAANMAEAHGKLTGEPGICFVTRGPGATHASTGVHTAFQDSTPMILFVGQVARGHSGREAFQEIDYRAMFAPMAKWVAQIEDPRRIPELVARAFQTATSGRPGPVVLALPEDMLTEPVIAPAIGPYRRAEAAPREADMDELARLLSGAERPLLMLGGGGWTEAAREDIRAFAEAFGLPVTVSFRSQRLFDNRHPLYAGDVGVGINPKLAARVKAADLLLVVGPRLGEATTSGYTLVEPPVPVQTLVHVHPGPEELGSVYQATLPVTAGMAAFAAAARRLAPPAACPWSGWAAEARADYLAWITPPARTEEAKGVDMGQVMAHIRERLPTGATLCNGAGNYTAWVHRFYPYAEFASQLAPTCGAMGYGVPAAVAAALECPERTVIAFGGDGCFLMSAHELATAAKYALPVISIVVNNGAYGTIRMHQEMRYPGRVHGTSLDNPDFVALGEAYGARSERVERTEDFAAAFERALGAGGPALIEIVTDIAAITPQNSISALRGTKAGRA